MAENETITIQLTITAKQGAPKVPLTISKTVTSSDLRKQVSETTKIPPASLKVIFRGRLIAEDPTKQAVPEFKLEHDSVLHCIGKPVEDEQSAAGTTTTTTTTAMPTVSIQQPAAAAAAPPVQAPAAPLDPVKAALQTIRNSNPPAAYQTAVTTLEKILNNIVNNPMEEKYRKVKKQNAAFQKRLGGISGGDAAMKAAGFTTQVQDGEEVYLLNASAEAWPKLVATLAAVELAAKEAKAAAAAAGGTNTNVTAPMGMPPFGGANPAGMMGGIPNFMPPGIGGMGTGAGAADPMAAMMADPQFLQNMMANPMVQNMLRNDPRFANNPMLQQMMQELASNPQLAAQVAQMMRDPAVAQQMQEMRQAMGVGGAVPPPPPGGTPNNTTDPAAMMRMAQMMQMMQQTQNAGGAGNNMTGNNATQPNNNNTAGGGSQGGGSSSDAEMTEEEMIAEAIRRSLQDGS